MMCSHFAHLFYAFVYFSYSAYTFYMHISYHFMLAHHAADSMTVELATE